MSWNALGGWLFAAIGLFAALFLIWPEIDLAASAVFYDGGFRLRYNKPLDQFRHIFLNLVTFSALFALGMFCRSATIGARRVVPLQVWSFIAATFIAGPLVLVNSILKDHWGRARPADIMFFGGDATFTPPLIITDQCASNCSFVSGEGAAIATVMMVLWVVVWPKLNGVWRIGALWLGLPFATFGIALRVMMGRHFLSDTIFAILFCGVVAWVFYRVFDMTRYRHALTWRALKADLWKK